MMNVVHVILALEDSLIVYSEIIVSEISGFQHFTWMHEKLSNITIKLLTRNA